MCQLFFKKILIYNIPYTFLKEYSIIIHINNKERFKGGKMKRNSKVTKDKTLISWKSLVFMAFATL